MCFLWFKLPSGVLWRGVRRRRPGVDELRLCWPFRRWKTTVRHAEVPFYTPEAGGPSVNDWTPLPNDTGVVSFFTLA